MSDLLPIVPGCTALITHSNMGNNSGEVVVGNLITANDPFVREMNCRVWSVNRDLAWIDVQTGEVIKMPRCPEKYLLRIDGGERWEQLSQEKLLELVE